MSDDLVPKKAGRPTLYHEGRCVELISLMSQGYKDCQIFAEWGISRDCFYRWLNEHKDFREAHDIGLPLAEKAWEEIGKQGMMGNIKGFSFNTWIAFMNRKFGWAKTNANNDSGGTTNINIGSINILNQKSNEQLLDYIKGQLLDSPEIIDTHYQIESDGSSE